MAPDASAQEKTKPSSGLWLWVVLAAVVLFALALRVHNVSRVLMWLDETDVFNENIYGAHSKTLLDYARTTKNTTSFNWGWPALIWIFCKSFGATIGVARMVPVLINTAGVLLVFCLVYRLFPQDWSGNRFWPAIFAALIGAVAIVQLEYSQHAYPYGAVPGFAGAILLAHFGIVRAASTGWKSTPQLIRAVALYTVIVAIALSIHGSVALIPAVSLAFLLLSAAPDFFAQPWAERKKLLRIASVAGLVLLSAALINARNPKYSYRIYLVPFYPSHSLRAIPQLLGHAYDLGVFSLNLFYNPALYWPQRLNLVLLPLVLLCVFGWSLAALGKFGPLARQLALLGFFAMLAPAVLSFRKAWPFGGVRQLLFLSPFFWAFTGLGFYGLRGSRATRLLGAATAVAYLSLWAANLPRFYREREPVYSADDIVSAWKENGALPIYARECERELRYVLRDHPEIQIKSLSKEYKPPYLIVATHNWIGDNFWYAGFPRFLAQSGFTAITLKQAEGIHLDSRSQSQMLYFPPNGFWVYKIIAQ